MPENCLDRDGCASRPFSASPPVYDGPLLSQRELDLADHLGELRKREEEGLDASVPRGAPIASLSGIQAGRMKRVHSKEQEAAPPGGPGEEHCRHRKKGSPEQDSLVLPPPRTVNGRAVKRRQFCIGPSRTKGAAPPLRKLGHGGIVNDHFVRSPTDLSSTAAQAQAEFSFLPADERLQEPSCLTEGSHAVECVPAAGVRLTWGRIPLQVAKTIVDRTLAVPFANSPANSGHFGKGPEQSDARG